MATSLRTEITALLDRARDNGSKVIAIEAVATGVPWWKTYPCACVLGKACDTTNPDMFRRCRCWGRTDVDRFDHLPPHCCARRATETKEHQPT